MRLLRGVYEGPGSHGVLRVVSGVRGARAVLRAPPEEAYFPALYGTWERSGEPVALTLSPMREKPDDTRSPGDLSRDLPRAVIDHPETEAVVLARSEASLLAGEGVPEVSLPHSPATGRPTPLVACGWAEPGMGEHEAAELVLEEMVRELARPRAKSTSPTVNLFGPPPMNPGAAAEYDEVERLLSSIGVGVNARVPLDTDVEEISRLPRAWANVVLYREVGEAAALFLQDEFKTRRVTTPMIGAAGTGAALRAVGELCSLDANRVRRAVWTELARTAKLPWYARLGRPETFRGRRVALFGDFTYVVGLGFALSREVGLEVAWAGTYLTHMEQDFLFHAGSFTEESFVTDDPEEVSDHVERTEPDVLVGTHLERDVADSLGIPFLPLCPPAAEHPFVQAPLMGYAGSGTLADALEGALGRAERRPEKVEPEMPWSGEALEELEGIPAFLRGRARRLAEERAQQTGSQEVTREILVESRL